MPTSRSSVITTRVPTPPFNPLQRSTELDGTTLSATLIMNGAVVRKTKVRKAYLAVKIGSRHRIGLDFTTQGKRIILFKNSAELAGINGTAKETR